MPVLDLFWKRQKRLRGGMPDVYQYVELPEAFRIQVFHLLKTLFGEPGRYSDYSRHYFRSVHELLSEDFGEFDLTPQVEHPGEKVLNRFLSEADVERALSIIELTFDVARLARKDYEFVRSGSVPDLRECEERLNQRFREHGVGFQLESGQIVRVDSQILHQEAVKPALSFLNEPRFKAANGEFLKAHEHLRHGRHAEAVNECLKSFESVLKVICKSQNWTHSNSDTAKALLDVVFKNNLIPDFLQSKFGGLRAILEGGIPTTRNRTSGHGAGPVPIEVPQSLANYVVHITASSILLLVEAEKELPRG